MSLKKIFFFIFLLSLVGCDPLNLNKSSSLSGATYDDVLAHTKDTEERALLEEACGKNVNSARCRQIIDPTDVAKTVTNPPGQQRTDHCHACQTHGVQTVQATDDNEWKPGCEVLEGGVESADEAKLQQCMNSIKAAVTTGAGRNREKIYCNMYNILKPEEQHFAGMVFTSIGEAGILSDSGKW